MRNFREKHHMHLPIYLAGIGLLELIMLIFRHGHL